MNFLDIIDTNSDEQKDNLLNFMHSKFSDEHQRMFIKSFYMTLFEITDKYPISDEEAIKWLGFSRKDHFKAFLERHLILNTHYISFPRAGDRNPKPSENFKFTVEAFKILGMKAGTKEGDCIRMYYIELEKQIFAYGMFQCAEKLKQKNVEIENLQNKNEILLIENETLNIKNGTPVVYIYQNDINDINSHKKIGSTDHYRFRSKGFNTTNTQGKLVFKREINPNFNLVHVERYIQCVLERYRVSKEVFDIDTLEAQMVINRAVNSLDLSMIQDKTERLQKLAKLVDYETIVIYDVFNSKLSTNEISTQTDYFEETKSIALDVNKSKFDKYIDECCILNETNEVSTVDIIGQYRIWTKSVDKDVYHALLDYLTIKFRPTRLALQNKDLVINGFRGVKLKDIEYKQLFMHTQSDPETFIFHMCNFTPSGKVLVSEIIDEYLSWRKRNNKKPNKKEHDIIEFKEYMKNCEYVLASNIWVASGNGQGWYGINLKSTENFNRKSSATAKNVEKRDIEKDIVLDSWSTIAKAAEAEGISAAKMSRSIKNNVKFGSYYYAAKTN